MLKWNDLDDKFVIETKTVDELEALSKKSLLCISGDVLEKVILI